MNDFVKIVDFEDDDNNSKKIITLEFSQEKNRIDKLALYNVEITETGEEETVYLKEISNRLKPDRYSAGKHIFIFEFGKTLFNDGAELSISITYGNNNNSEKFIFVLKNNTWELKENM